MKKSLTLLLSALFCILCIQAKPADNAAKPFTVPEVAKWKGAPGSLDARTLRRVVYSDPQMEQMARRFATDYTTMFGSGLDVVKGKPARQGDIVLSLTPQNSKLGDEGYTMEIGNNVTITAATPAGANWASRTLLQLREAGHEIPRGKISDAPAFPFRGFMIDAGRKFIPMPYLYKLVDAMAYRKLNKLHIHLNDNGFKYFYDDDWDRTQAAFRMESDTYPALTARDGHYTKQEFRTLQDYAAERGVEIIAEIDFPAHALAFTRFRPEIGSTDDAYGRDHLDLTKEATYTFLDSLLEEYIGGPDPVFKGSRFHIGTDEYSNRDSSIVEKFRYLTDRYIRFTEEHGKKPLIWGSLTHARGKQPVKVDGVEMYLWSTDYANPDEMLELGYDVVSIPDGWTYIVPAAGYYYDFLNTRRLYDEWTPSNAGRDFYIDPANPHLKGGAFAVWNDHPNNGITVHDIHLRTMDAMPVMATKMWNSPADITVPFDTFAVKAGALAEAPGVNYLARHATPQNGGAILSIDRLVPGSETGIEEVGYDYVVEFDIEGADEARGTALFTSPEATFWLSDPISGCLAFSREDKLYHFRHDILPGEKAHIRIEGDRDATRLYVDGRLVDNLDRRRVSFNGSKRQMSIVRTLVFPLQQAGDFRSNITNLTVVQK